MGDDGAKGARDIFSQGGSVLVEAPETAVVSGMPMAVQRTGVQHHSLGIWALGDMLAELTRPSRR
jgi:two-component system chemotaxis response regulator CheB